MQIRYIRSGEYGGVCGEYGGVCGEYGGVCGQYGGVWGEYDGVCESIVVSVWESLVVCGRVWWWCVCAYDFDLLP
jgi:hypothetical protein